MRNSANCRRWHAVLEHNLYRKTMKYLIFLIISMLLVIPACKKKPTETDQNAQTAQEPKKPDLQVHIDSISEEEHLRRLHAVEKHIDRGEFLPARPQFSLELLEIGGRMKPEDLAISFEFVRPTFSRCMADALFLEDDLEGDVVFSLKREKANTIVLDMQSEIKTDHFEDCIRKEATAWFIPMESNVRVKVHFSALPPMKLEEMREYNDKHDHRHHDHGDHHDHGEHGDLDHEHDVLPGNPVPEAAAE